jgi:hypothetical protein
MVATTRSCSNTMQPSNQHGRKMGNVSRVRMQNGRSRLHAQSSKLLLLHCSFRGRRFDHVHQKEQGACESVHHIRRDRPAALCAPDDAIRLGTGKENASPPERMPPSSASTESTQRGVISNSRRVSRDGILLCLNPSLPPRTTLQQIPYLFQRHPKDTKDTVNNKVR